jgi:hypothetical protein
MNTETLATAIRIAELLTQHPTPDTVPPEGRYVIVRGDRSGVFCGNLVSENGQTVELTNCRHIWYWAGAANTAELALRGPARPNECKIVAPVNRLRILDAIEVIDCTSEAESALRAVSVWTKS